MDSDDDRRGFNLLTARWLALGAAAGSVSTGRPTMLASSTSTTPAAGVAT